MLQMVNPLYYVTIDNLLILNCTATNDPQSPNELRFRWYKESTRIDNNPSHWNVTELSMKNILTVTSQIIIAHLTMEQHNGTYTCSVDNSKHGVTVNQTTNIIVESEYAISYSYVCN